MLLCGCSSLTSINVPDSVTEIYDGAFSDTGLTSFRVPSQIEGIGGDVFQGCANLKILSLPNRDAIKDIEIETFSNLTTINFEGSQSDWIDLWDLSGYDDPIGEWKSSFNFTGTIEFNTYPSLED